MIPPRTSFITALTPYLIEVTTPLRVVLERIDKSPGRFQLIVDADRRLLGTVTDGDIRRSLLRSFDLEMLALNCMHSEPLTGRMQDDRGNYTKLRLVPKANPFLPILDAENRVCGVLVDDTTRDILNTVLVMAGGEGRRLGEVTKTIPKPLLPVRGRPILDQILDRLEANGASRIFISVRYLSEQIEEFIEQRESAAEIELVFEDAPLGTGGAVALLPAEIDTPVLVINGDVLTEVNFLDFKSFNDFNNFDGCVAATRHKMTVPFGVIQQTADGVLSGITEKPSFTHLVSAGVYYIGPELRSLSRRGEAFDMPELLISGADRGLRIGIFPLHEKWRDMGRPDDFKAEQSGF